MIVKCNVAGTVELSNLNLTLVGGQIIDLHTIFTPSEVQREQIPPNGCLFQAFNAGWITTVALDSPEYKNYERKLKIENEKKIKEEIKNNSRKLLVKYYKKNAQDKINFINSLNFSYYDFLIELQKNEKDEQVLYVIFKKIGSFADRKIEEGFVLI